MKYYCDNCGTPNEYVGKRPTSCGSCRKSFATSTISLPLQPASAPARPTLAKADLEDDDPEHPFDSSIMAGFDPRAVKPAFRVTNTGRGEKIGEIIRTAS